MVSKNVNIRIILEILRVYHSNDCLVDFLNFRFLWGYFRSIFDTYWAASQPRLDECCSAKELKVYTHKFGLMRSPQTNSNSVESVASLHCQQEFLRDREISLAIKPYSLFSCGMWHQLLETAYWRSHFAQWQTKRRRLSYGHNASNWQCQSPFGLSKELSSNQYSGPKSGGL